MKCQNFKKNSDWCLTAHAMFVKVCQVTARETNLQILFKRLTKRNLKKCLTQTKRFANIYKLSRDESTTNLENQRSINTQTLKILKNFQRPAMVKRSKRSREFIRSKTTDRTKLSEFWIGKNLKASALTFNMRVRSWLRMNAGGVPNTCKSNEAPYRILRMKVWWLSGGRVSNAWVTCPVQGDNS